MADGFSGIDFASLERRIVGHAHCHYMNMPRLTAAEVCTINGLSKDVLSLLRRLCGAIRVETHLRVTRQWWLFNGSAQNFAFLVYLHDQIKQGTSVYVLVEAMDAIKFRTVDFRNMPKVAKFLKRTAEQRTAIDVALRLLVHG